MTPELTTQLEACKTLPSPPGVATNHEVEKIGVDHACVGGWLLKR